MKKDMRKESFIPGENCNKEAMLSLWNEGDCENLNSLLRYVLFMTKKFETDNKDSEEIMDAYEMGILAGAGWIFQKMLHEKILDKKVKERVARICADTSTATEVAYEIVRQVVNEVARQLSKNVIMTYGDLFEVSGFSTKDQAYFEILMKLMDEAGLIDEGNRDVKISERMVVLTDLGKRYSFLLDGIGEKEDDQA